MVYMKNTDTFSGGRSKGKEVHSTCVPDANNTYISKATGKLAESANIQPFTEFLLDSEVNLYISGRISM